MAAASLWACTEDAAVDEAWTSAEPEADEYPTAAIEDDATIALPVVPTELAAAPSTIEVWASVAPIPVASAADPVIGSE